ncbi:hypothetical protein [Streptomyces hirsutus]|uniref:hypothetical protein n=1 Tax=Streptomyces hirsutus TaxID=35620 RepID=UPI0036BA0DCA
MGYNRARLDMWPVARKRDGGTVPLATVGSLKDPVDLVLRAATDIGGVRVSPFT